MTESPPRLTVRFMYRPYLLNSLVELAIVVCAGIGAFLLRFEFGIPRFYAHHLVIALAFWIPVKLTVFHLYLLHRQSWKFFCVHDAIRLGLANVTGSAACMVLILAFAPGFPRSIPIIDFLLCSIGTACVSLAGRAIRETVAATQRKKGRDVILYGAGAAGVTLLRELRVNPSLGYNVFGFVDDNPALARMYVQGAPVLGRGADLAALATRTGVREVLIASPSASGEQMVRILNCCQQAGVRFRTVCPLGEMIEGKGLASQIRQVDVQDLLCRTPARLDHREIRRKIENKVVMVTGAAGSIGSELCYQLARFKPTALIGYDIAETALFYLEQEMRTKFPDAPFYPEIGSVQNPRRMREVLKRYGPSVLYHSAAYKHVPLMESSLFEAIENNVLGTWNAALAARDHGVGDFVLISSDKAVRPVSVMGATKRLCELLLLTLGDGPTRHVAVRFGNVLGSNGSVIPIFKAQIAKGGPVTVTHPEMRRYFMTIPEAAQLVLQASAMGHGGEIFVLDMGQPLKIVDVARNLILLSGLRPEIDIKIEFTGARPGEKLAEELNLFNEETVPTHHGKIKIFLGNGVPEGDMSEHMATLRALCDSRDIKGVILALKEIVPEYNPSAHILRQSMAMAGTGGEFPKPRPGAHEGRHGLVKVSSRP